MPRQLLRSVKIDEPTYARLRDLSRAEGLSFVKLIARAVAVLALLREEEERHRAALARAVYREAIKQEGYHDDRH